MRSRTRCPMRSIAAAIEEGGRASRAHNDSLGVGRRGGDEAGERGEGEGRRESPSSASSEQRRGGDFFSGRTFNGGRKRQKIGFDKTDLYLPHQRNLRE